MNITKSTNVRSAAIVHLVQCADGARIVYEFTSDPGHFHDASGFCSLYGTATRLTNVLDAAVVPDEYIDIRYSDAVAAA